MMPAKYNFMQEISFTSNHLMPRGTQVIRFSNEYRSKANEQLGFCLANACEMYWHCTNSPDGFFGFN